MQKTFQRLKTVKLFTTLYRLKIVQILIPIVIIGLIIWAGQAEFRRIDWAATLRVLHRLEPSRVLLLIAMSLAAVASVSGYEFVLRRHFRLPIGRWTTFRFANLSIPEPRDFRCDDHGFHRFPVDHHHYGHISTGLGRSGRTASD